MICILNSSSTSSSCSRARTLVCSDFISSQYGYSSSNRISRSSYETIKAFFTSLISLLVLSPLLLLSSKENDEKYSKLDTSRKLLISRSDALILSQSDSALGNLSPSRSLKCICLLHTDVTP